MRRSPEIALLLSTYEKPSHLRRALLSIALQEGVGGAMELVVTDDGSTDETPRIVEEFAGEVDFPVRFVTHPHEGFQLSRCRNEGVRAATAPYLLFLDGDCILPPDHVRHHLDQRRERVVMGGDCCRMEQGASERIDEEMIRREGYPPLAPPGELRRLAKRHRKARFYNLIRHPAKPKLVGNNIALWRKDYERVNGYDERFVGWGCEDDDLRLRLKRAGVRVESILGITFTYHLWHPPHESTPERWREGANVAYLRRPIRLTRCRQGLEELAEEDLFIHQAGEPQLAGSWPPPLPAPFRLSPESCPKEVELLFVPGRGSFSGGADCNILVVQPGATPRRKDLARAHIVVGEKRWAGPRRAGFPPGALDEALRSLL